MKTEITSAELAAMKVGKSTYSALDIENRVLESINEDEGKLRWCRDFIEKNRAQLAGLHWSVGYCRTRIDITCGNYYCTLSAKEIAARWPAAKWKRVKPDGVGRSEEARLFTRDWTATIDGLKVVIAGAEKFEPVPVPEESEVVL